MRESELSFVYPGDGRRDSRLRIVIDSKERFEMKRAALLTVALITAILSVRTVPAATSEQSDLIVHKPLGSASLGSAVVVRGFRPGRPAGVSSDITGARHWSATIRGVPKTLDFGTTVTVGGGTETGPVKTLSSLEIRELRLPATGATNETPRFALAFTPKLASPSYRLEIWNGPTRVFEVNGLKTGGAVLAGNDPICDAIGKAESVALGFCIMVVGTCSSLDDQGRFNWTIRRVAPVPWVVSAVSRDAVVGDQLRIVEETPSAPGQAVFRRVNTQGLNLSEMVLMDELATATVPDAHQPGQ
jgi:hypothetical protein